MDPPAQPKSTDAEEPKELKEIATRSSSANSQPSPVPRSSSQTSLNKSVHVHSHRASFAENLRNAPPSPRAQRHPSFTQAALQDLLNHPPASKQPNPRFAGREWRDVTVAELVSTDDVRWADIDTSVEDATRVRTCRSPSSFSYFPNWTG